MSLWSELRDKWLTVPKYQEDTMIGYRLYESVLKDWALGLVPDSFLIEFTRVFVLNGADESKMQDVKKNTLTTEQRNKLNRMLSL